jgi:hypothetical protein
LLTDTRSTTLTMHTTCAACTGDPKGLINDVSRT